MTAGLNDSSPGHTPLVFENPVNHDWPPHWNADAKETFDQDRCWKGARIIIGLNDSSVSLEYLRKSRGESVDLAPETGSSQNLFEQAIHPQHDPVGRFLPVE